jgi:hypothetical protein
MRHALKPFGNCTGEPNSSASMRMNTFSFRGTARTGAWTPRDR